MKARDVQFALDTGDHLKVGKSDSASDASNYAREQLQAYVTATDTLGKPFYLTMGNHECAQHDARCDTSDPVLSVFLSFINRQLATTQPYYTFDRDTPAGRATFVFVADTAWDATEATWLESAMSHGDSSAYTVVVKHVPSNNVTDFPTNADELQIIERHRFSLLLSAHAHLYQSGGESGREVTLGLGGAPVANAGDDWAYGLVEQQPDGRLKVTIYNATSDTPRDTLYVAPN